MFRHEYIARIGFVKNLDLTCPTHRGMYASAERTTCPKCNTALVPFTVQNKKYGVVPQVLSEIVIYPITRPADDKLHESRTERAGGFGMQIRVNMWGHYDDERKCAYPDNRVQYLQPKRKARFTLHTKPVLKPYTSNKDGVPKQMIEMKYEFNNLRKDDVQFLDKPAEYNAMTANTAATPAPHQAATGKPVQQPVVQPTTPAVPDALTAVKLEMDAMAKRLADAIAAAGAAPVPTATPEHAELVKAAQQEPPSESEMDYPADELIADEDDPFPVA